MVERDGDCSADAERKSNSRKRDDGGAFGISVDDADVDLEGGQEQVKDDTDRCREVEVREGGCWEDGICEAGYPAHHLEKAVECEPREAPRYRAYCWAENNAPNDFSDHSWLADITTRKDYGE